MKPFSPPKPEPRKRRANLIGTVLASRRSWFAMLVRKNFSAFTYKIWTPLRTNYLISDPELVDRILSKEADRFPKSGMMGTVLSLLLGNGIFVSNGEDWRKQRRMIEPAFNQARIHDVFGLMLDATEAMGERLAAADANAVVAIDEEMAHVTADIIFRTIFSRPLGRDEAMQIYHAFGRVQELLSADGVWTLMGVPNRLLSGRRRAAPQAQVIRNLLEREVERRLNEKPQDAPPERKDILASLLRAVDPVSGDKFTRQELVDQISLFFMAGHETSATALSFALYMIAMRPDVQKRMHEEAVAAFGGRRPAFADMRKLKFTRDVFRETLRLYPTLPLLGRDATRTEKMRSRLIKAGSIIFISPYIMQRHRKLWERPDAFDPDRFSRAASRQSIRSAYIPFGAGPRVCVGASFAMQEGVLILAHLARHVHFEPVAGQVPVPVARLTLRSENGVRLHISRPGEGRGVPGKTDPA